MLKEYEVNQTRRWDLAKKQVKRHPKWKKRKWVRWTLLALCIASPIVGIFIGINYPVFNDPVIDKNVPMIFNVIIGILLICAFPCILTIPYFASLRHTCFSESNYKLHETLCLTDEGIQNVYHPLNATESSCANEESMLYSGMVKLVYNEYHKRFEVFGKLKSITYLNYERNVVDYTENHEANEGYSRRYYAYYENFEDFMNTVSEKSGLPIEHINYLEE